MSLSTHIVRNANVILNGKSLLGRIEEFSGPMIKPKMSTFKPLGLVAETELMSGFEKMESKLKFTSIYADLMVVAADFTEEVSLQIRSSVEVYTGSRRTEEQPYVCFIRGSFKALPSGNFKQNDNVELEADMNVTYCKIEVNGQEIVELDIMNNIYKVNGQDKLAKYRANLGL